MGADIFGFVKPCHCDVSQSPCKLLSAACHCRRKNSFVDGVPILQAQASDAINLSFLIMQKEMRPYVYAW